MESTAINDSTLKVTEGLGLTILVPCFNESNNIEKSLHRIKSHLEDMHPGVTYELLVVNDGSTDGTKEILEKLALEHTQLRIHSFEFNKGRGAALKVGYKLSRGRIVITLDADLTYEVYHIDRILEAFSNSPNTDIVVVSPYMKGGTAQNVPFNRLLLSKFANWLLTGFFSQKISTVTCVVRGYRGGLIRELPLFEEGKELHLEVLRKAAILGCKIVEVPGDLVWKKEDGPRRKTNLKVLGAAKNHLLYGLLIKPTRLFKYLVALLFLVSIYEYVVIGSSVFNFWPETDEGFWRKLWIGLSSSFNQSPHTFFIAGLGTILSIQTFFSLATLQILKMQQEEVLKHIVRVLENQHRRDV